MYGLNINQIQNFFGGDTQKTLLAVQRSLRKTEIGRGNLLRAEIDGGTIKLVSTLTGQRYDNIAEAFEDISAINLTQIEQINLGPSGVQKTLYSDPKGGSKSFINAGQIADTTNNPRRSQMSLILNTMQDKMQQKIASGDAQFIKVLDELGIAHDASLGLNLISSRTKRGGQAREFLNRVSTATRGGYVPFIDDEGIDLLQMTVGGRTLSSLEMHLIMSHIGNDIISTNNLVKAFGTGGTVEDVETILGKLGKRARGVMSERDITFTARDIIDIMSNPQLYASRSSEARRRSMTESFYLLDPTDEIFARDQMDALFPVYSKYDVMARQRVYFDDIDQDGNVVQRSRIIRVPRELHDPSYRTDVSRRVQLPRQAMPLPFVDVDDIEGRFGVVIEEGLDVFRQSMGLQARGFGTEKYLTEAGKQEQARLTKQIKDRTPKRNDLNQRIKNLIQEIQDIEKDFRTRRSQTA